MVPIVATDLIRAGLILDSRRKGPIPARIKSGPTATVDSSARQSWAIFAYLVSSIAAISSSS
jgi:hypothetical protein